MIGGTTSSGASITHDSFARTCCLSSHESIAIVSRVGKGLMALAAVGCIVHFSFPVVPISLAVIGGCLVLGVVLYAVASFAKRRLDSSSSSDALAVANLKAAQEKAGLVKNKDPDQITVRDLELICSVLQCFSKLKFLDFEQKKVLRDFKDAFPILLSKINLTPCDDRFFEAVKGVVRQYVDCLSNKNTDLKELAKSSLVLWATTETINMTCFQIMNILSDIHSSRSDDVVLELLSSPALKVNPSKLTPIMLDIYLDPAYQGCTTDKQKTLFRELRFFRQEPILYYYSKTRNFEGFRLTSETLCCFSSIEDDEYKPLLDWIRTLGGQDQVRVVKGLYSSLALKQLQSGVIDKIKALKGEFGSILRTHDLKKREVFLESHGSLQGGTLAKEKREFYVLSADSFVYSDGDAIQKRDELLGSVRDSFISCLKGESCWQDHFYLDRPHLDFPNFNSNLDFEFSEVKAFKDSFESFIKAKFKDYSIKWQRNTRNNFQSTAAAAFVGDPKCRQHQDHTENHWISFCFMVTGNNYEPERDGMGVYVTQETSEGGSVVSKHTSVMGDNQILMFPSTGLHGTDIGHEPDFNTPIGVAPCRLVANFRCEVYDNGTELKVDDLRAKPLVENILKKFYEENCNARVF